MSCDLVRHIGWRFRRGVTLVEQLLVIAIIGLLMALTFVGLGSVMDLIPEDVPHIVDEATLRMASISGEPLDIKAPPAPVTPGGGDVIPDEYVVRFHDSVPDPTVAANNIIRAMGRGRLIRVYNTRSFKGCHLYMANTTAGAIGAQASVKDVEANLRRYKCEITPTGISRIQEQNAFTPFVGRQRFRPDFVRVDLPDVKGSLIRSSGAGAVVAVADTGVNFHPDLNVTRRFEFGDFPSEEDRDGHGTHVAGTIGAKSNGLGVVGVCPGVEIWSLKVLDPSGSSATVIAGINFCTANADTIDVLNMSLGGPRSQIENDAVDACVEAGVIVIVAAGNDARDASAFSPASAPLAICVGAFGDSDGLPGGLGPPTSYLQPDDCWAVFSNFGPTVDVAAPGVDILSTWLNGDYAAISGTSMASPNVAGLMAYFRDSVVITEFGNPPKFRPATGLEIVALFMRNRGPEPILRQNPAKTVILEVVPMMIFY